MCVCGSPSFRFNGECDGGSGGGGIIVRGDRGIAFPGLILRVAIHIGYLAENLASHTQGSDKKPREATLITTQLAAQKKKKTKKNPTSIFNFLSRGHLHECDSELKFSSINNIHSASLTISQQWGCGMNAFAWFNYDGLNDRLSPHNSVALPYWAAYFGPIVCCQRVDCWAL